MWILCNSLSLAAAREFSGIGAVFLKPGQLLSKDSWAAAPLPVDRALEELLKYDAFWCAQTIAKYQPGVWKMLRERYPDRISLFYVTPFTVRPDGTEAYLDYEYIQRNHPEWFLLTDRRFESAGDYNEPDKRIRWNPDDPRNIYYNRFFLDVGNADFQDWAVSQFLRRINPSKGIHPGVRYSGITADNVLLTAWHKKITKRHPGWKYARSASEWNQAYFSYLKKIYNAFKQQGYLLFVNHTTDYSSDRDGNEWQDLMAVVDGMVDENALGYAKSQVMTDQRWQWSIKHHEQILSQGLYDWWICIPAKDDSRKAYEQFLYMYCSFLLTKKPGKSFFSSSRDVDGKLTVPWYKEYDLPLGKPLGPRYIKQDCWWRDYENAKIVVNPSQQEKGITMDSNRKWLDWAGRKEGVGFTLAPVTAKILLPTVYSAGTSQVN